MKLKFLFFDVKKKYNNQFFFLLVGVDAYLLYNGIVGKFSGIRIYLVELYILTISLTSEFS